MRLKSVMFLPLVWLLSALTGCAVTSTDGTRMSIRSDAFADYVDTVFRRQNTVATQLRLALDDAEFDSPRYLQLEQAETDLQTSCRSLNELASARRAGDESRGIGALKRARQAPDCERAATAAAKLL